MLRKKTGFSPFGSLTLLAEDQLNQDTKKFFQETVDMNLLVKQKSPKANLKNQYKKVLEISIVATLVLLILLFQFAKLYSLNPAKITNVDMKIEVADIPVTEQFRRPPPPQRPSVPIPTEDESIPEDVTIAMNDIDLTELPPPPPQEDDELPIFVAYDVPPKIIGGIPELQKYLKYPRLAQNAGVEGTVFINVLVGINGKTEKMKVIKAKPANIGFEDAAMEALKKVRWEPARQRDQKIRVWISIPVRFNLVG
jgi:protein TonB